MLPRHIAAAFLALMVVAAAQARAVPLPQPESKVVLRVTGNVANPNSRDGAEFDVAMLERLGVVHLTTRTPWTKGPQHFTGVPAARVLAAAAARGGAIDAVTLNGYSIAVPLDDLRRYGVILAMRQDGRPLRPRDRGPLWLVYPWSRFPEIDDPVHHARSIWPVKSLIVR
jgi:hypothetical protein